MLRQEQIAPSRSRLAQGREYQQRTLLRQMPTLSQLTKVGKNLSSFNRGLVCSYTTVPAL